MQKSNKHKRCLRAIVAPLLNPHLEQILEGQPLEIYYTNLQLKTAQPNLSWLLIYLVLNTA